MEKKMKQKKPKQKEIYLCLGKPECENEIDLESDQQMCNDCVEYFRNKDKFLTIPQ